MNRRQYFWKVFKHSFHGAFRFLEIAEATVATALYSATYLFPVNEKELKVAFVILSTLFFLTLFIGFFLSAYSIYREDHDKRAKDGQAWDEERAVLQSRAERRANDMALRNRLGAAMNEGMLLQVLCSNESLAAPDADVQAWADGTENILRSGLGESYVARFRNPAGLPIITGMRSITSLPHDKLWRAIRIRLARIEQFLAEMGPG